MIQDLGKGMEAQTERIQEMFNKELKALKNKQTEMNSIYSTPIYDKNSPESGHIGNIPQHNKGCI